MVLSSVPLSLRQTVLLCLVIGFGGTYLVLHTGVGLPSPKPYDRTTVTVESPNEAVRGTVTARVADTLHKKYVGLSHTESLADSEGMLFVHRSARNRTYAMRGMPMGIDIVFIDSDHRITAIHSADAPTSVWERHVWYDRYRGYGKWVLEVPAGWTAAHNVSVGDRVYWEETTSSR